MWAVSQGEDGGHHPQAKPVSLWSGFGARAWHPTDASEHLYGWMRAISLLFMYGHMSQEFVLGVGMGWF